MAWFILVIAGVIEAGWAIGLKYTDGFTKLGPSVLTVIGIVISMAMLSLASRTLPIGTAYAVWVGIGAAGAVVLGIVFLGEAAGLLAGLSRAPGGCNYRPQGDSQLRCKERAAAQVQGTLTPALSQGRGRMRRMLLLFSSNGLLCYPLATLD